MTGSTTELFVREKAADFYEQRYRSGYMEAWPKEKQERIQEFIRSLQLAPRGDALDFGCGNGVLTDVLRKALPSEWRVFGSDVSGTAIRQAATTYPECVFLAADDPALLQRTFDLVFTHHVLEHVHDINMVVTEMNRSLRPTAAMIHILPCGNAGSFEHSICLLRSDGIDPDVGNRFFFEDEGHLRRLTTDQICEVVEPFGFKLGRERYSSHRAGAIDWITQCGPRFLRAFTRSDRAIDAAARAQLNRTASWLWLIWLLRYPCVFAEDRLRSRRRSSLDFLLLGVALLLYTFSKPVDVLIKRRARTEWQAQAANHAGSEMFLYFERRSAGRGFSQ